MFRIPGLQYIYTYIKFFFDNKLRNAIKIALEEIISTYLCFWQHDSTQYFL